ncbi:HNH endonuclease [Ilyomonas limi]|uniref:HNH endonuclease n=1 Tax=Ilyomonas limi TaxID=2575867 RepID=A0A4U3KRL1_9BACT|nr:HNH endonuclease [Ilyomonas limi]TKK64871.1 HNH endonuclease [Ilyomonas limi]
MKFEEVSFDLDDKNLFLVDDLKLRAEAIRHSILPRLEIITNHSISLTNERFKINVLELSTVLKFPNFRKTRAKEFDIDYTRSEAGLGGKRNVELWKSMLKKNGEPPMIIPFSLTFSLDEDGLSFFFLSNRYNLTMKDNSLFYDFHLKYADEIANLVNESKVSLQKYYAKENDSYKIHPFICFIDYLKWQRDIEILDLPYFSRTIKYPISNNEIELLVSEFITFYPIYDSYLRLASGNSVLLNEQIGLLKDWFINSIDEEKSSLDEPTKKDNSHQEINLLKLAEAKIKVMPALRWQVFQRDNWRCVSCGRTTDNGIVLHVDHIIPRSKGGQDHLDNYQTLCDICNIGKSNKDQTNLRERN